ncbi:MAG TPA: hypothetical protein VLS93_01920 [Anaeromyxobacteraceae bacterium]|nr:hypothetical protein [Anaeromyxobacteraceae bacterium]
MRALARLVAVAGAIAVAAVLFRSWPHDVTFVYDRLPGATALEVEVRRGGETLRRARIRLAAGTEPIRHPARLPDGTYELALRVELPSGPLRVSRTVEVDGDGPIRVPLAP